MPFADRAFAGRVEAGPARHNLFNDAARHALYDGTIWANRDWADRPKGNESGTRPRPSLHRHDAHAGDGCGAEGQLRPSRHADGAWRRSPTRCGSERLRFDPADPLWPNRDRFVLSVRPRLDAALFAAAPDADPRGREIRGARQADRLARRHQEFPPARQLDARAIPNTTSPAGVETHHRAARARGRQQSSAWRSPSAGSPAATIGPGFALIDYNVYRAVQRRRHDGGHLQRGGLDRRAPASSPTSAGSTTATASRSRARPTSPSARMWGRASWPMAGTCCTCATPTTAPRSARALDELRRARQSRPTMIIVQSHIGYGAPHKQDTAEAHGEPLGEDEVRATKRVLWLARGRAVPGARRRLRPFRAGHRRARRAAARANGAALFERYRAEHPDLAARVRADAAARAARGLGARDPELPRRRQAASRAATRRARC